MSGVPGLGRRTMAGQQGGGAASTTGATSALDRLGLQVTPANVLGVRAVLMEEATELRLAVKYTRDELDIGLAGGDPVSPYARAGFQECNERYLAQVDEHIQSLFRAGERLGDTARSYGIAETEIAASFKRGQTHPPAPGQVGQSGGSWTDFVTRQPR